MATTNQGDVKAGSYYRVGPRRRRCSSGRTLSEVPIAAFEPFPEVTFAKARLSATVHANADGAIDPFPLTDPLFPRMLTDTTTHEACLFAPAADGKVRCLPEWSGVRYTTPACAAAAGTGIVASYYLAMKRPTHAAAWSGDVCTGGFALSKVEKRLGPQVTDLWDTTFCGDFCLPTPMRDETLDGFSLGDAEPAAGFVEATLVTE
jgi:hypothetical protein